MVVTGELSGLLIGGHASGAWPLFSHAASDKQDEEMNIIPVMSVSF